MTRALSRRSLLVLGLCAPLPGCFASTARGTIGAILVRRPDGRLFVRDAPAHLASARAGIRPGDELLLIEGQDVRRLTDEQLQHLLTGQVDEPVKLTLVRRNEVLRLTVKRSQAERYRPQ